MNSSPVSVASFVSMPSRWQAAIAALALPGAGTSRAVLAKVEVSSRFLPSP